MTPTVFIILFLLYFFMKANFFLKKKILFEEDYPVFRNKEITGIAEVLDYVLQFL